MLSILALRGESRVKNVFRIAYSVTKNITQYVFLKDTLAVYAIRNLPFRCILPRHIKENRRPYEHWHPLRPRDIYSHKI